MTDPLICCIMPCHRNPAFIRRAIRSFRSQSYLRRWLLVLDNAAVGKHADIQDECKRRPSEIAWFNRPEHSGCTVGGLRNYAIGEIPQRLGVNAIAHFDYDDWSAPNRLQYQLDFMRSTGVAVVGFNDMCFYDAVRDRVLFYDSRMTNYGLGTSLFYKREAWERVKFPDITPEDTTWQHQIGHDNIRGCSSIVDGKPMMIQVLHGGNAAANASGAIFEKASEALEKQVREILATA